MDSGVGTNRNIRTDLKELLEYCAYTVIGKHGEIIYEKFPVSLQNEDDRVTFEAIKKKFDLQRNIGRL